MSLKENGGKTQISPIQKKINDGKLPYDTDGLLYSLWKYANAHRLTQRKLIPLTGLIPLEVGPRFAIFDFLNNLKKLDIELEKITFHEEIYKKFCAVEYRIINEYIAQNPKSDFAKAIQNLFKNKAKFSDIFTMLGKLSGLVSVKVELNGLLEFIEFSPTPSIKNSKPLEVWLDRYIQCFIEDKLFSEKSKNFYRFSRQREIFLYQIKNDVENYGKEFVFQLGLTISESRGHSLVIGEDAAFLHIHSLIALEKQGFFEVERILTLDMETPPEKQTDDYKIKIVATDKLLENYEQGGPKSNALSNETDSRKQEQVSIDNFIISIRDREIWINQWLISKPHAVGSNYEFFEHIQSQNPHTKINREKLPSKGGLSLKEQVRNKSFIKILNSLGFKGEVLKAFFYSRGKDTLIYRGNKITKADLENAGVNVPILLKELDLAHSKNSPE